MSETGIFVSRLMALLTVTLALCGLGNVAHAVSRPGSVHVRSSDANPVQQMVPTTTAPSPSAPLRAKASSAPAPAGRPFPVRIALYGDSLATEASHSFQQAVTRGGRAVVKANVYPGTAICDWLPQMRRDARGWRPDAVVVEFVGNALTPCMKNRSGHPLQDAAYFTKYESDTALVTHIFAPGKTRIYFVGGPAMRMGAGDPKWPQVKQMYAAMAGGLPDAVFVDAGQSVMLDGTYTDVLSCLPQELCLGSATRPHQPVNVVRAPDGVHFCPTGLTMHGRSAVCSVWSSGAYRFGEAMAAPVVKDFGLSL